jgi:diguanylate cyclase (GGDEF)-like protein/PAS domain S-box-containing protein
MLFQYNIYFVLLSVTAIISVIVAFVAWQQRSISSASNPFILMMLAIAGYAAFAAMEAVTNVLHEKIFWSKLEYVGSGSVITLFLIFVLHFTHHHHWLTPRNMALLWVMPAFNVALVATNEWHHLVWSEVVPDPHGSSFVIYAHNLGFYWVMVCVYIYVVVGIVLLIQKAVLPSFLYRQQSRMVIAGALLPLLGASIYTLRLTPPGLNLTPISFMLTGLICFVNLFHFRMFDLVPIARDTLIEKMSDAVLVLDVRNRLIDMNPAAKQLIGTKELYIGQSADQVLAKWQEVVKLYHLHESVKTEILIDPVTPVYVEVRLTSLYNFRKQLTGQLIVIRDITQRYQAEMELRKANESLQKQVLEIKILQAQLQEQAARDGLTGLFNRRYFDEKFPKELMQAAQNTYSVALIVMDIDYFKAINDTFGHQAGDRVIQAFADLLRYYSRSQDIVCRYGGEEFVLALPRMTQESAFYLAEQIRLAFHAIRLEFGGKDIQTTVSGGVGVFPEHGKTSNDLLKVVDQALYAAKLDGRNCIKCVQSVSNNRV